MEFNFLALTQGRSIEHFKRAVENSAVADRTWVLPFIPHWKIPGFIRACTAVCFLERRFPIKIHTPKVQSEILYCGTCLVLSQEIALKQSYYEEISDRENLLLVQDPEDHQELAAALRYAIEDPARARAIGMNGHELVEERDGFNSFIKYYEEFFQDMIAGKTSPYSFKTLVLENGVEEGVATEPRPKHFYTVTLLDRLMPWMRHLFVEVIDTWHEEFLASKEGVDLDVINIYQVALDFCDFLEDRAQARTPDVHHELLASILRFQRARLWASYDENHTDGPPFLVPDQVVDRRTFDDLPISLRPIMSGHSRIEEFDWDVDSFLENYKSVNNNGNSVAPEEAMGLIASTIKQRASTCLFYRTANLNGGILKISDTTKYMLGCCDGAHTVSSIIDRVCNRYGVQATDERNEVAGNVVTTLKKLYAQSAIVFAQ